MQAREALVDARPLARALEELPRLCSPGRAWHDASITAHARRILREDSGTLDGRARGHRHTPE